MLDASVFSAENAGNWYVLHTMSRQEKALGTDLERLSVPFFLPLVWQVRYYGKRKQTVSEPLFPGYVFVRGSIDQAYSADRTGRVANVIRVSDQATINSELHSVAIATSLRVPLDPYPFLKNGVRVRVKSGPMAGMHGVVEGRGGHWNRLVLQIQILGQAASLEIDGSLLELLE
jgi:transcription termination/antitermination protein NusG